jgi:hypothetical protein
MEFSAYSDGITVVQFELLQEAFCLIKIEEAQKLQCMVSNATFSIQILCKKKLGGKSMFATVNYSMLNLQLKFLNKKIC